MRIPQKLLDEIEALAKTMDRPKSYIMRQAIGQYIEEYADYQIALDRLHDKDDRIISSKELRDRLGD